MPAYLSKDVLDEARSEDLRQQTARSVAQMQQPDPPTPVPPLLDFEGLKRNLLSTWTGQTASSDAPATTPSAPSSGLQTPGPGESSNLLADPSSTAAATSGPFDFMTHARNLAATWLPQGLSQSPTSSDTSSVESTPPDSAASSAPAGSPVPAGAQAPAMPTGQPPASAALPDHLDTSSRDANLTQWAPALQAVQAKTGLRADALAAIIQAENGGGQSPLSATSNNYFSISAVDSPYQIGAEDATPGYGLPGRFGRYKTPQASLDHFVDLVSTSPRYAEAWANRGDPQAFFNGLVKGGYIVPEPGFPVETWLQNLDAGRQHYNEIAPQAAQATPAPSGAATAQPSAMPSASSAAPTTDVDQAALDDPDKWALCGPVAAVIAAGRRGANWTVAQAKQISQAANLWDAGNGMHGLQSEVDLLNKMNIPAKTGSADPQTLISEAQSGNTPIVSTNNHYFVLTGYDPATGTFDTTTTGGVYKAGARRMTLDQIERVGGGIQGAAYFDNPSSPTPSVAASPAPVAQAQTQDTGGSPWTRGANTSDASSASPGNGSSAPDGLMLRQPLSMGTMAQADSTSTPSDASNGEMSVPAAPPTERSGTFTPERQIITTPVSDPSAPYGALPSNPAPYDPSFPDPEASRNETVPGLTTPQDAGPAQDNPYGQQKGMIDRRNVLVPNDLPPDVYGGNASLLNDAPAAGAGASTPSGPGASYPSAGAFQDDQTQSGYVQPDMAPGPPATQPIPQPSSSPMKPLYDLGGNIMGYVHTGLDAAGNAANSASDAISAAVPQIGPALNAAGLPDVATPVIKTARGAAQGIQESMSPEGTYLNQASDLGTWIGNGIRAATGRDPVETPRPTGAVAQAMDAARRAGYALVSGSMQANVAADIWREFGLPTAEIAGLEINPGVFLVPGRFAGGGMEAAAGPAAGRVAGAIENIGDRAATAVRGAVGAGFNAASDAVRSGIGRVGSALDVNAGRVAALDAERAAAAGGAPAYGTLGVVPPGGEPALIHAPDPAGAPNAGLAFTKPGGEAFTPEEIAQVQDNLAARGIEAHPTSDPSVLVIPAHDVPPGFVAHVKAAVQEAGYGPSTLEAYAGETRSEAVGNRPAGIGASGDQAGAAESPGLQRAAGTPPGAGGAADSGAAVAGERGYGDRPYAGEAVALPDSGRPTAAGYPQVGSAGREVQPVRGAEPHTIGGPPRSTTTYGVLGAVPPEAPAYRPTAPEGFNRMYHGTASDFPSVNPDQLNRDSLYRRGYYLTSDPRVAGGIVNDAGDVVSAGYAQQRNTVAGVQGKILRDQADAARAKVDAWKQMVEDYGDDPARGPYARQKLQEAQQIYDDAQSKLYPDAGPNVRPVDVPHDLNLVRADAPLDQDLLDNVDNVITQQIGRNDPEAARALGDAYASLQQWRKNPNATNDWFLQSLMGAADNLEYQRYGEKGDLFTQLLQQAGYNGIEHSGGKRVPMLDSAGAPIEHTVNVIFPDAVGKVRNALSGTYGGATLGTTPDFPGAAQATDRLGAVNRVLSQGVVSAVSGGMGAATAQQLGDPNDPNRALKGFVAGAVAPYAISRGAGALARAVGRDAEGARGVLSTLGHVPGEGERGVGATTEAFGINPENTYQMRFRVVDLGDLIPSHTDAGGPHPNFPPELQPRLRDRAGSQLQIDRIAKNLNPDALLTDVRQIDRGPMIVGPDGVVESGNGRVLALRRAAQQYPEQYAAYANDLKSRLPEYGLKPADIEGMQHPVLVRERMTDVNRPAFAAEANQSAVLAMSPYEQALQDARNLPADSVSQLSVGPNQSLDAAIMHGDNRPFVRAFMATLPGNEQAALLDSAGNMNAQGLQRVKAALFASTYGGESGQRLTRAFFESLDPTVKNVEGALNASLPDIARVEAGVQSGQIDRAYSISDDVSKAVDAYARLKASGQSVGDYLAQADLFGNRETTPLQDALISFMDENRRSQRPLRDLLKGYAEGVEKLPPPDQVGMFGPVERAGKGELLDQALADVRANTPKETADGGLFTGLEQANPEGAARENPSVGSDAAAGQELARPESPREPARPTPEAPTAAPATQQVARTAAADLVPRGGPEGTLAVEGPPQPVARPGAIPENVAPRGGPEGLLAVEGAPQPTLRPGQIPKNVAPTGGPTGTLGMQGAPTPLRPANLPPVAQNAAPVGGPAGTLSPSPANLPPQVQNLPAPVQRRVQAALPRAQAAAQQRGVSAMDWIRTLGNSGIFGPASATVNVGGAVTNLALSVPKEFIRAAVRGQPAEYMPMALATFRAIPEMFAGAVQAALASHPSAISSRGGNAVTRRLGYAAERPASVLMGSPDAFFRPMFDSQGMYREAAQVATSMGQRGAAWWQAVEDGVQMAKMARNGQVPPNPQVAGQISAAGKAYANRQLFQGELNPGSLGKAVHDLANRDGLAGVIGNVVLPFTKTPYHMANRTLENVPGSALFPSLRGQQPTRFDTVYDQMFGSVLAGGLLYAASQGRITGPGPSDPQKRQQMISQGWSPNSVAIGGHFDPNDASQGTVANGALYIPTRMLGQYQPIFDTAGGAHDALAYEQPEKQIGKVLTNTLGSRGVVTNMVYLSGLANILSTFDATDPTSGLPRFLAQTAERYIPGAGIARAAATAEDPLQRQASSVKDVGFQEATRQQAAQSVPGALGAVSPIGTREDLRPSLDVLGRPAVNPQRGLAALGPKMTTGEQDPVINAFEKTGIDISQPRTSVTIAGASVPLTPEEQDRYKTLRGEQLIRLVGPRATGLSNQSLLSQRTTLQMLLNTANSVADAKIQSEMQNRPQRIRDALDDERVKKAS